MKTPLLLLAALMLFFAAGCTTRYVDVRGEKFEMISEKEEKELVKHARVSIRTISKKIPPGDMEIIQAEEPEVKFIYSGDRYGRAVVRWSFPRYEVGIQYEGEFMTRHMGMTVFSKEKQPEIIDFTRKTPRRRAIPARRRR